MGVAGVNVTFLLVHFVFLPSPHIYTPIRVPDGKTGPGFKKYLNYPLIAISCEIGADQVCVSRPALDPTFFCSAWDRLSNDRQVQSGSGYYISGSFWVQALMKSHEDLDCKSLLLLTLLFASAALEDWFAHFKITVLVKVPGLPVVDLHLDPWLPDGVSCAVLQY